MLNTMQKTALLYVAWIKKHFFSDWPFISVGSTIFNWREYNKNVTYRHKLEELSNSVLFYSHVNSHKIEVCYQNKLI